MDWNESVFWGVGGNFLGILFSNFPEKSYTTAPSIGPFLQLNFPKL
jgi:hypothetical protein